MIYLWISHYIPPEVSKNAAFPVFPWNRKNKINFSLKLAMESKSVLACSNTIFKNIITLSDIDLFHKLVYYNCLINIWFIIGVVISNYSGNTYFRQCPSLKSFNDLASLFLHCYFHLSKKKPIKKGFLENYMTKINLNINMLIWKNVNHVCFLADYDDGRCT